MLILLHSVPVFFMDLLGHAGEPTHILRRGREGRLTGYIVTYHMGHIGLLGLLSFYSYSSYHYNSYRYSISYVLPTTAGIAGAFLVCVPSGILL
jgi:hypothetical protein